MTDNNTKPAAPAEPHHFTVTVHLRAHAADQGGNLIPQEVRAYSLVEALHKAAEIPLTEWFPDEDENHG